MSKNIVDEVLSYSKLYDVQITLIPSRRQIDKNGGYVNNWTTQEFCTYVKQHENSNIIIERDHGGPGQGFYDDDGMESLLEDAKYMDILHIDPWKKYPIYKDALKSTIDLIQACYKVNPNLLFEVGTEESIRSISCEQLELFLQDLKEGLTEDVFKQIHFVVIQCGTQLLEKANIGDFNETKLQDMINIVNSFGKKAKEHNGDWVSLDVQKRKEVLGLQYVNIAPELGELETEVVLSFLKKNPEDIQTFFKLCLDSGRWKKWVSEDFKPEENKEKLIRICGHYVFSHPIFQALVKKYLGLDKAIRAKLRRKLMEIHGIFDTRTSCIFCQESLLEDYFEHDKNIALSTGLFPTQIKGYFIPFNIQRCTKCNGFQNKYLGNLTLVYGNNHIDNFGTVKSKMHSFFSDFIVKNKLLCNTLEIGACHDVLSRLLLEKNPNNKIHIIDPYFTGHVNGLHIIPEFIEKYDISTLDVNAIIMSSVFEHFYNPIDILKKLHDAKNIKYIYLNHPDLEGAIKNDIHINFNIEHTFYISTENLIDLFEKYGFSLTRKETYSSHTIGFEFTRKTNDDIDEDKVIINYHYSIVKNYLLRLAKKVENINQFMIDNSHLTFYLWPTSIHLSPLFVNGLDTLRIKAFLDNSPNKIGKYLYGYPLQCESFEVTKDKNDPSICILLGGSPMYQNELQKKTSVCKFLEI
jgi:hypothetical protein